MVVISGSKSGGSKEAFTFHLLIPPAVEAPIECTPVPCVEDDTCAQGLVFRLGRKAYMASLMLKARDMPLSCLTNKLATINYWILLY